LVDWIHEHFYQIIVRGTRHATQCPLMNAYTETVRLQLLNHSGYCRFVLQHTSLLTRDHAFGGAGHFALSHSHSLPTHVCLHLAPTAPKACLPLPSHPEQPNHLCPSAWLLHHLQYLGCIALPQLQRLQLSLSLLHT
jgi:hypothetical protein